MTLTASAERTVTDQNPRVYACNLTLVVGAGDGPRESFVELLSLRRTVVIEGQESSSTGAAAARFGARRLYPQTAQTGIDTFSATFPFKARFDYTLYYRDLSLRIDSVKTTTPCG